MAFSLFRNRHTKADRNRAAKFGAELEELELAVAGRFARGNIALQSECILTSEALEQERVDLRRKVLSK